MITLFDYEIAALTVFRGIEPRFIEMADDQIIVIYRMWSEQQACHFWLTVTNDVIIFTSANLSANRRIESYMIGKVSEVDDIEKVEKLLGCPGDIFLKSNINIDLDRLIDKVDFDIDFK